MTATTAPFLTTKMRRSNRTVAAAVGGDRKEPNVSVVVAGRSGPVLLVWSGSSGSVSTESSTAAQGSEGGGYGTGDDEWKSFFFLPTRLSPSMVVMVVSLVVRRRRRHGEDDNKGAVTASPPSHGGHESFNDVGTSRQRRGARRRHRELLLPSLSMASTAASRRQRMVASWVMAATKSRLRTATSRVAVATGPFSSSRHISLSVFSSTAAQWPSLAGAVISLSSLFPSSLTKITIQRSEFNVHRLNLTVFLSELTSSRTSILQGLNRIVHRRL
ncbi:hypothetical protein PIB30_097780 [Stylosanthes scabra]|uniref:Uncharacterized protein n=1 Tax=Stylosanthes scabra TaxID=79078 RepID=A0ABU6WZ02_9FABA|nr:hypothetical protein [Stylosanthes scabra]